jgi:formylglycine-generating enzyme required for sulfatase activity
MKPIHYGKRTVVTLGASVLALAVVLLIAYREQVAAHVRFWRAFERLPRNAQGYREYRHRETGIVFVSLAGGTFWMGASEEEVTESIERFRRGLERDRSMPWGSEIDVEEAMRRNLKRLSTVELRHRTTVSPFLIARYEVSRETWKRVMGSLPPELPDDGDLPVVGVTLSDCEEFCARAGLRIPSEAQWEFACRGGTTTRYWCGETLSEEVANYGGKDGGKDLVGGRSFGPNPFGL